MSVNMKAKELERGWITIDSQVADGILYAIQAEVILYGIAWFSMNVSDTGSLKTAMMPSGEVRTKEIANRNS